MVGLVMEHEEEEQVKEGALELQFMVVNIMMGIATMGSLALVCRGRGRAVFELRGQAARPQRLPRRACAGVLTLVAAEAAREEQA